MGIRVAVVDDNPHVRWHDRVYPVNATFHRFLSGFLDLPGVPVASIVHAVPLRDLPPDAAEPATEPLDPRIRVVGTTPFDGIGGYLRRAPGIIAANTPILRAVIDDADLVWIKVPASNALLAGTLAAARRRPRFVWVAGSARDVARARYPGAAGLPAAVVGAAYDALGRLVAVRGDRVVVGTGISRGEGVVTSLVEAHEVRRTPRRAWSPGDPTLTLAWAGRLVEGKGLEELFDALALLRGGPPVVRLLVVGDGPARAALAARASALGLAAEVDWRGYVADRAAYLDALASADAFIFPSRAEGFPKVILDAMAVGLPVLAVPAGSVAELVRAGLVAAIEPADRTGLAEAVRALISQPAAGARSVEAASAFVAAHTRTAEAERVVDHWRRRWPRLAL